jgi:hypothetical protein
MKWWKVPGLNVPFASMAKPHPNATEIPEPGSRPAEEAPVTPVEEKKGSKK